MSTPHTANVYVTNGFDGNAVIKMSHQYSSSTPDVGQWSAAPGETVGPLVVNYMTGFGTGFDYWFCSIAVIDGSAPGMYTTEGSLTQPKKECMLESADADKTITNTIDASTFATNLPSGGCRTGVTRTGPYSPITNVFVLMLENRSFDHLFGFSGITGRDAGTGAPTSIEGLSNQSNVYEGATYSVSKPAIDPMTTDPGHEFLDTLEQLCGEGTANPFPAGPYPPITNSGFVANYATTTTEGKTLPTPQHYGDVLAACDTASEVPAIFTLATEFAICDHWFASMPGPTWPNRFFAMGASSTGLDDSPSTAQIAKWETYSGFTYPNGSVFDLLKGHGLQYRLYNDSKDQFARNPKPFGGQIPIVSALKNVTVFSLYGFDRFASDLHGPYPYQYTFIEPNYGDVISNDYEGGSSQHPMDSLAAGDAMVAATYNAIRNSPLWDTSLLIITYDEHGGFYDHVAPPGAVAPGGGDPNGLNTHGFDFKQLGVRVPAVVVSPLIAKNTIDHTVYDHTTILKTVEELYALPNLTERDAAANDLRHLLTGAAPRTDCPAGITSAPAPVVAEVEQVADGALPVPTTGNAPAFLHAALKNDLEMAGADEAARTAAQARFDAIETRDEARTYLADVGARIDSASRPQEVPAPA